MEEKLGTGKRSAATMAAGGGLLLGGLLFALWALNTGVTAALMQVVDASMAVWLAPLLLAAVLLAVGWPRFPAPRAPWPMNPWHRKAVWKASGMTVGGSRARWSR